MLITTLAKLCRNVRAGSMLDRNCGPPWAARRAGQVKNMGGKSEQSSLRFALALTIVVVMVVLFVFFSRRLGFAAAALIVVGSGALVAVVAGLIILYETGERKRRLSTIRAQRPRVVLVDGATPAYMTLPPATEGKRRKVKSTGIPATLAVTLDAVELWTSENSATLTRSIPRAPGIKVATKVVNFGQVVTAESGTANIERESIVVTGEDGTDIIISTRDISRALQEVTTALNEGNVQGCAP